MIVPVTDIGSALEPKIGISPQSLSGTAVVNGTGIDRLGGDAGAPYESADLEVQTGTSTGAPTSYAHAFTLQDSADNATFANFDDTINGNSPPTVSMTADGTIKRVKVCLKGARQYVRVVATPAFTGGTSPTTPVCATLVLGGAAVIPTP